jgi:hypothetical protein
MNLITSENYLKEYTNINKNVDMTILTPAIYEAQLNYILPILGTKLYNEILSQIGTNTVTSLNQTLLDNYVLPCLMHYAKYEALPDMKYRLMNKGVQVKNSDNSTSADLQEIQFLMDREKVKAEKFAERTTRYLRFNVNSYPLYTQNNNYDEVKPNRNNVTGGIWVGNDKWWDDEDNNILIGNYQPKEY